MRTRRVAALLLVAGLAALARPAAAADTVSYAVRQQQDRAALAFHRGLAEYHAGRYAAAATTLAASALAVPSARTAWWLAQAKLQQGDFAGAEAALRAVPADTTLAERARTIRQFIAADAPALDGFYYSLIREVTGDRRDRAAFTNPSGVAVDGEGNLHVAALGSGALKIFGSNGELLREPVSRGKPFKLALDAAGNIYYTDFAAHQVVKLDPRGEELLRFGGRGAAAGQFLGPEGIAVDRHGCIYVVDNGNHRVQKFDPEGKFLARFGRYGTGEGQLRGPVGLALLPEEIQVADYGNHRIARFDYSGNWLGEYGADALQQPRGLAYWDDNVFVADARGRVQVFTADGELLGPLADAAGKPLPVGQPFDVAVGRGVVLVGDYAGSRLLVCRLGGETGRRDRTLLTVASVNTAFFPTILQRFSVWSAAGTPLTGLTTRNFSVSEQGVPVRPFLVSAREELNSDYSLLFLVGDYHTESFPDLLRNLARELTFTWRAQLWGVRDDRGRAARWRTTKTQLLDDLALLPARGERAPAAAVAEGVRLLTPETTRKLIVLFTARWADDEAGRQALRAARMNCVPLLVVHSDPDGACPDPSVRNLFSGDYQPLKLKEMIAATVSGEYLLVYKTPRVTATHQAWHTVALEGDFLGLRSRFAGGYVVP